MPVHQGRAKVIKEFFLRWTIILSSIVGVLGVVWLIWPGDHGHPVSAVASNGISTLPDKLTLPDNVKFDHVMLNYTLLKKSNDYTLDVSSRLLQSIMEQSGVGRVVVRSQDSVPILVPRERLHDIEVLVGPAYMVNLLDFDKDKSK